MVCPTFNDLRSLNHTRLPKRTGSMYENREIISHKEMILAFSSATISSANGAPLFAPGGEKLRNFYRTFLSRI